MYIYRIFFSSYLSLLYGASVSILTDILIRREFGAIQLVNVLDPRIHWSTIFASSIYYIASPHIVWWFGQDEFRHTLVKWKMRGSVFVTMTIVYPLLTIFLSDIVLICLGEKIENHFERYSYAPPIAIILTAICEWCGVNRTIRQIYLNLDDG